MLEPLHSTVQAQILVILLLTTFLQIPGVFTNPQQTSSEVSFTHHHELPHRDGNSLSTDTSLVSAQSTISGYISSPTKLDVDFNLKTRPTAVYRPRRLEGIDHARPIATRRTARNQELEASVDEVNVYTTDDPSDVDSDWDIVHLNGPDVQDLHTLAQLARMSGNAYALGPSEKNWYELDGAWNISFPFGYEDAQDGFRGHVFLSSDNSTIVLAIKGTTIQGPTSKKDKFNDNLLFSCCCARVDFSWVFRQVCDCYSGSWRCDNTCLSNALVEDSLFYTVGLDLVNDLQALYPSANLWLVGHSLGGALASLLGSTFGLPAVAFESPGERLAASRLGLPFPSSPQSPPESDMRDGRLIPSLSPSIHVYHTADPIPQGTCTGSFSPCAQVGYALETHCHLGKSIVFDSVTELGWKVDVRRHTIREVIGLMEMWDQESSTVLEPAYGLEDWLGDAKKRTRRVPEAKEETDCVDCFKWEFGDFKDKKMYTER
ncbi:Lipase [Lentinula raphanica]|nr:Lipase [Lentinula raphanica]